MERRCLQLPIVSNNDIVSINREIEANKKVLEESKKCVELAQPRIKFNSDEFPVTCFNFTEDNTETEEGLAETILFYKYLR